MSAASIENDILNHLLDEFMPSPSQMTQDILLYSDYAQTRGLSDSFLDAVSSTVKDDIKSFRVMHTALSDVLTNQKHILDQYEAETNVFKDMPQNLNTTMPSTVINNNTIGDANVTNTMNNSDSTHFYSELLESDDEDDEDDKSDKGKADNISGLVASMEGTSPPNNAQNTPQPPNQSKGVSLDSPLATLPHTSSPSPSITSAYIAYPSSSTLLSPISSTTILPITKNPHTVGEKKIKIPPPVSKPIPLTQPKHVLKPISPPIGGPIGRVAIPPPIGKKIPKQSTDPNA